MRAVGAVVIKGCVVVIVVAAAGDQDISGAVDGDCLSVGASPLVDVGNGTVGAAAGDSEAPGVNGNALVAAVGAEGGVSKRAAAAGDGDAIGGYRLAAGRGNNGGVGVCPATAIET